MTDQAFSLLPSKLAYRSGEDVLHATVHLRRSNTRTLYHIPPRQSSEHILCEAKHENGVLIERFESGISAD